MKRILLAVTFASIATVAIQASYVSNAFAKEAQAAASTEAANNANKLLLESVSCGDLVGIEAAVKMNADVNGVDSLGNSVLECAIMSGSSEVVKKVLTLPDIKLRPQALVLAAGTYNIDIVKDIFNAGADLNFRDPHGWSAFMVAVDTNDEQSAVFLLEKDAPVDVQALDGRTALMLAVANLNEHLINIILGKGADITLEDKMGRTAADYINIDESDSDVYRKRKVDLKDMLQERVKEARNKNSILNGNNSKK